MGVFFALAAVGGLVRRRSSGYGRHLRALLFGRHRSHGAGLYPTLSAAIGAQRLAVVALAAVLFAVGYLLVAHRRRRKMCGRNGTAIGIACLSMVANLYALPATGKYGGSQGFRDPDVRISSAMPRRLPVGTQLRNRLLQRQDDSGGGDVPKDWPEYLIVGEDTYNALAAREMRDYSPVLKSGATYLDNTGQMLLIKRKAG